jgi:DNA-binding response OmpR family regulator
MAPKPVILLGSTEKSQLRALAREIAAKGYTVVTANAEPALIEQAQSQRPHAIILDVGLAPPGYGLARTLRSDPAVSLATAIVLTGPGKPTRAQQLEAWRAGAWDYRQEPLDLEDLLAHLAVFIEAKRDAERLGAECLVDRPSGLYNPDGLTRRAGELAALAVRQGLSLACAVFRPSAPLPDHTAADRLAIAFRTAGRNSDAIGRTGPTEFAVFAPGANTWAAARLVRRMTDAIARELSYLDKPAKGRPITVRSGYSASQAMQKISPPILLAEARTALEATRQ